MDIIGKARDMNEKPFAKVKADEVGKGGAQESTILQEVSA